MNTKNLKLWAALLSASFAASGPMLSADDDTYYGPDGPVSFETAIALLQEGWEDVYVSVIGSTVSAIDEDDFVFDLGSNAIVLDAWIGVPLAMGEAIQVVGELEVSDDPVAEGLIYELDADFIYTVDGTLIAARSDADDSDDIESDDDDALAGGDDDARDDDDDDALAGGDDDARDDDDDDALAGGDDDARDDDDDDALAGGDDDDDDDEDRGGSKNLLSFDQALARLEEGWDEAYISVQGIPLELLGDDDYRFSIDGVEVVLDAWDGAALTLGETLDVTGELERSNDYASIGLVYELDATRIMDLAGNRIGDDDDDEEEDDDDRGEDFGKRVEGTLAELVAILEAGSDDDLNVRTTGILGELVSNPLDDDEDYLFADGSGVVVILDLDSRAKLDFAFTAGVALEIIGELDFLDADDFAPEGILYELDAVWIRLADGTTLDVGQMTPFAESTITDWIGYFWKVEDEGWYYHPTKGFVYGGESFGDDDWFFSANINEWIYAARELYPFIFSSEGGWNYLLGSSYGMVQHAYNYATEQWVLDYWHSSQPGQ